MCLAVQHERGMEKSVAAVFYAKDQTEECDDFIDNTFYRRYIPYFVSAVLAQKRRRQGELVVALFGLLVHLSAWSVILYIDTRLFFVDFYDEEDSMKYKLQLATFTTVAIAGGTVVLLWMLQLLSVCLCGGMEWSWNDGLLPPFLSSVITGNIKVSAELSKFLLFFCIFEPVAEVQNASRVLDSVRNTILTVIVLKYYAISLTMNNHRVKVYDDSTAVSTSAY